ncbi:MAG: hypothetical protein KAH77_05100 [Thiomargarita sp.]|nr:hypothetical protein [Thiomargarita sp.]
MKSILEVKNQIQQEPEYWQIPFMDFVDDFRRYKDMRAIETPYLLNNEKMDALIASMIEYLCHEHNIDAPHWVSSIPACQHPWFVAGIENLKAIALVESPLEFRIRKIFVLENFLYRV